MSNVIKRDGESIFYCVNWEMDLIYKYLSYVIKEEGLQNDKNICDFLDKIDQHKVGRGNVFVEVFNFFGPSDNKPPLETLFKLIGKMTEEIQNSNCQKSEFIETLKAFQQKILLPKTRRLSVIPDASIENSVKTISDYFDEFIYSLQCIFFCSRKNKMSKLIFKYIDGYYQEELERDGIGYKQKSTDAYLSMLAYIFNAGPDWLNGVKRNLLNPLSTGLCNDMTYIKIKKNIVIIDFHPVFYSGYKDCSIEIDKQILLDLINKWQELVAQKCKEITFHRHNDGMVTLSGK